MEYRRCRIQFKDDPTGIYKYTWLKSYPEFTVFEAYQKDDSLIVRYGATTTYVRLADIKLITYLAADEPTYPKVDTYTTAADDETDLYSEFNAYGYDYSGRWSSTSKNDNSPKYKVVEL